MQTLILGTAQWGSAYGVTNQVGRLHDAALADLVATARNEGVVALDTAPVYGDAEERIARWAPDFSVTTKVAGAGARSTIEQLHDSLARLGRSSVERCLVHDWPTLDRARRADVVGELSDARDRGLVGAIGVSGYVEADLDACLDHADILTIAQIPMSILDQRLEGSGTVRELRRAGWRFQARSVLLQGLLVAPPTSGLGLHPAVLAVAEEARRRGLRPIDLAAAFVATRDWVDEVVVGVTSSAELVEVAQALAAAWQGQEPAWGEFASDDVSLIDPRTWSA